MGVEKVKKLNKKKIWSRSIVQLFFFVLIALIAANHFLEDIGRGISFLSSASLHSLCPFGGVVSIYQYMSIGTFIQKIHESSFILMIIAFILAVLFGPVFCGWVCPLGTIQEWFSSIGKRIFKRKFNQLIPYKYDKYLRFTRYSILAWVIYMTGFTGKLVFSDVDPYYALFNFWSSEIAIGGLIILAVTLVASLLVERPWCKYACPYGALLGLSNLLRIFKIRRYTSTCISCDLCNKSCPMNITVSQNSIVKDHQCISCMKCTSEEGCPVADTVEFSVKGGN